MEVTAAASAQFQAAIAEHGEQDFAAIVDHIRQARTTK